MSAAIVPSLESSNGVCDTTATPRWSVGHQRAGVLPCLQIGRVKRLDSSSATPWNQLQFCQSGKFRLGLLSSTSSLRLAAPGARVYYLFVHLRVFSVGPPISLRWHRGVQHNSGSSLRVRSPDFFQRVFPKYNLDSRSAGLSAVGTYLHWLGSVSVIISCTSAADTDRANEIFPAENEDEDTEATV
ncbi:hypothetical protein T06_8707 [Trichinella sp. T6]|nr:hypothetical protein T06_8707 [Trichinella sp. T6]